MSSQQARECWLSAGTKNSADIDESQGGFRRSEQLTHRQQAARDGSMCSIEIVLISLDWLEPFGLVMIEAMACGTPVRQWTLRPCAGPLQRAPSRHRNQDILEHSTPP